tara:strand:- start:1794 stop:2618 length:825 start_codon:yes stop_codon:yes gene_type:complete
LLDTKKQILEFLKNPLNIISSVYSLKVIVKMPNKSILKFTYELAWGILCLVLIKQGIFRNRVPTYIKQMYYINLDNRQDRNTFMLEHVIPLFQEKNIPWTRVTAQRGQGGNCVSNKNQTDRCKGLVGIIKSNLYILENLPIVENTLILEDDWTISSIDEMNRAIHVVPKDWDIIRFDCWGKIPTSFEPTDMNNVFKTAHVRKASGWFCGGGHAMLIRPSAVPILKNIWSKRPYDDLDCRLTSDDINSYCVNHNIAKVVYSKSDIPKKNSSDSKI